MKKIPVKLTYDALIALLQGKELRVCDGENEFIFAPPFDGVFMTHEQLSQMRYSDQMGMLGLLKNIGTYEQNGGT